MKDLYHYTLCGLDYIWLKNGYSIKETKYGTGVSIHDQKGLHHLIADNICNNRASLSGSEFRFLRKELKFSQKSLGDLLDVSDQTVANWEKGVCVVSKAAQIILRSLYLEGNQHNGAVSETIEIINRLDREIAHLKEELTDLRLELEDSEKGW